MDRELRFATGYAIEACLIRFFHYLDRRDYPGLLGLFTPNGVWIRQGEDLTTDTMMATLSKRPVSLIIRHVVSSVLVEASGPGLATCDFHLVVYRHDDGTPPVLPAPLAGPAQFTDGFAELDLAGDQPLFRRLVLPPPIFRRT